MDIGQDEVKEVEPRPTHEAGPWNVLRGTLTLYSHEVDGTRYIGGAGRLLDEEIRSTWNQEARQLVNDLIIAFRYLPDATIRAAASEIAQAADATIALRGTVPEGVVQTSGEVTAVDVKVDAGIRPRRERPRRRDDAATALDDTADVPI